MQRKQFQISEHTSIDETGYYIYKHKQLFSEFQNYWSDIMTQETIDQVLKFRDDRNWKQFHNPKDLAVSISLEAAELLEVFQWSGSDTICESKKDKIREELADVLNYCILMADVCGLDMDEIVQEKIEKNNAKYPVDKAKNSAKKYDEL